ncbi:MAG: hypothetical protein NUV99_00225 [Clostridia bacterium]|nr:hypothetical protein [Clostridia bacterium]
MRHNLPTKAGNCRGGSKPRPKPSISSPRRRRPQGWPETRLAAALGPLTRRVKARFALETVRLSLFWGLAAAGALLVFLYLAALSDPVAWAGLAGLVAAGLVTGWRIGRRPDALDVVRIADGLGAGGRAVTAFRLLNRPFRDPWAEVAVAEGLEACAALEPENSYPVLPSWRPWCSVVVLGTVLILLAFLPNPLSSAWLGRREAREALAEAARRAGAVVAQAEKLRVGEKELLTPVEKEELRSLVEELRRSATREEAAAALKAAAAILEEASTRAGPRAGEDLPYLAAALRDIPGEGWRELGEALSRGDARRLEEAAQALADGLQTGGKEAREEAAMALLRQAEATGDLGLRRALREAARSLMPTGAPGAEEGAAGQAMEVLSASLSSLAVQAKATDVLARGAATLGAMARALSGGGNAMAVAAAAGAAGNPAGMAGAGGSPAAAGATAGGNPGGQGNGAGQGSTGGSGSGGAAGGAAGSGTAGNTGSSGGSGSGGGNGEGSAGGSGEGDGGGKGTGGPGSGGHGAGTGGGGLQMVYAPSLLGGTGEQVRVSGEIREGEAGSEVTLEDSPLTLGEVRPYTEVYPRYRREAQESLVQAPLPPALEDLVWKYFTSLEPGQPEGAP